MRKTLGHFLISIPFLGLLIYLGFAITYWAPLAIILGGAIMYFCFKAGFKLIEK